MEPTDMNVRAHLLEGQVIPAMPLALNADGSWSERHQRALVRYYAEAGAGGIAVGVHTTQFAIREPAHARYEPVLRLCAEESRARPQGRPRVLVAGICGPTAQARQEAETAQTCGYHVGLLSLSAMKDAPLNEVLSHCRAVAAVIPLMGFYLQPDIGGAAFPYAFWRAFAEIENVVAIKMAPFDRYATLEVIRAVMDAGRDDIALYTGNDDNIINDLLTPFSFGSGTRRIVGGLLGQWAVWTKRAVEMLDEIKVLRDGPVDPCWLTRNAQLTDANAALFDAANGFRGCLPGIMEVLRREGLLPSIRCLDADEVLSPGQAEEIDRVIAAYPDLQDREFLAEHRDGWLDD